MLALFDKVVREHLQIPIEDKVLLAISGGVDSMVLLDLFMRIGQPVAIAHCNYGLRGIDSDQDEALVTQFAKSHQIKFHLGEFKIDKSKGGIQEQARTLRYAWFEEIQNEFDYTYISTAHHLDDQVETFMINLIRGTGIDGLSGIPQMRGSIIRPLLAFTKDQINLWAKENKVIFRADRSNDTDDYLRNRIRHHITPLLLTENPNFYSNFQRTTDKLRQANFLQLNQLNSYKYKIIKKNDNDIISLDDIPQDAFSWILFNLLKPYGINWDQVKTISDQKNKSGLIFHSNRFECLLDKGRLIIQKTNTVQTIDVLIDRSTNGIDLPNHMTLSIRSVSNYEPLEDPNIECLDENSIKWPLRLRQWTDGDSFTPLGMNGRHQKLQDYFTNNKINKFDKKNILILEDQDSIIWIVGHRMSHRVKINDQTTSFIQLAYFRSDHDTQE